MVEEKFKIGIDFEVTADSLTALERQIKRATKAAFSKATAELAPAGGTAGPIPGGTATVRSARETVGVKGGDFAKQIARAVANEQKKVGQSFDAASKRIVASLDKLAKALETRPAPQAPKSSQLERLITRTAGATNKQQARDRQTRLTTGGREQPAGGVPETKRGLTGAASKDQRGPRIEKAKARAARDAPGPRGLPARELRDNLAIMETQRAVAEHVRKIRNQANQSEVAAAKQARQEREAGAKALIAAGGGATVPPGGPPRGGGPGGPPRRPKPTSEATAVTKELKRVEAEARTVSQSLSELRTRIEQTPGLGSIQDIFKQIGFPKGAGVGPGASVEVKKLSGEAKTATGYIEIFGNEVKSAGNVVNKRIKALMTSGRLQEIGQTARHRPQRAVQAMKREMQAITNLPTADRGAMAGYQRGGVRDVTLELTKKQQEVINGLSSEADRLAAANEMLHKFVASLSKAEKAALGLEKLSSLGLSEEIAPKMTTMREEGEGGRPGKITGLKFAAQARDLAGMGLGGAGAMREARSFLVTQAQEIKGGAPPAIMGRKEAALYEQGLIKPTATKTLRTAVGETGKEPQTAEDLFLIDKSVVMNIEQFTSKTIPALAKGLAVGSKLVEGQALGKDVEGEDITFDAKGVNAEIDTVEKVVKNGIEMWRIRIKEINKLVTGAKITTGSGMKGVVMRADLEKRGYPKGTEAVMSAEGMAKRGVLKDPMIMMAGEIAKQVGASGQEVANKIEAAMQKGGQDISTAVKGVAEQYGLKGFTGATKLPEGPLRAGGAKDVMMGDLPFYRLPKMGQTGPTEMKDVFFDAPGMQAAGGRAETTAWVEDARKAMDKFGMESQDFIKQLLAMTGATEVGAEGLRKVKPEEFKRLPEGADLGEAFQGTIADVKQFGDALEVMMPARGGGEFGMRIPGMGKALGQRETFKTPEGLTQTSSITNLLDRIMETGTGIKAGRGEIPLDASMEETSEVAHMAARAMQEEIEALQGGGAAAEGFVKRFMPLIKMLEGSVGLQYEKLDKGGKPIGKPSAVRGTAEEYVSSRKGARAQALAIRDVLATRAATVSGPPGKQTRSVAREGEIFKNAEMLGKTLEVLGITLDDSSAQVQKLHDRLEGMIEGLLRKLTALGPGTVSGGDPLKKRLAQQKGAGVAPGGFHPIVSLPTDVSKELENVRERLISMRDAGQNVSASLEALDRMMAVQKEPAIARDAVVLNREDYKKLTEKVRQTTGMGEEEAKGLMKRGVLHRFPTTGGASFRPVKIQEDVAGQLPAGKMAIAAPMAVSSPEDLSQMLAPLKAGAEEAYDTLRKTGGVGQAAEKARSELNELVPILEMLQSVFLSAGENADFDGDMESIHSAVTKKSSDSLRTFTEQVQAGGISFKNMMTNIIGAAGTKGGMGGIAEYGKLFGKTAKLREGPFQAAVLAPQTARQTGKEAYAHTAGKLNIGIATDAFNKAATAVLAGSGQMGDAFSTGVEMFNLQLNKALSTKHGGEGGAGGLQLIEDLRKGQVGRISKGMGKGGAYEELGDFNKQYREQMEKQFLRAGPEGVRGIAKAEGIEDILPKDLTAENFMGSVKKMVDALDLNGIFHRMFEMMKANMIKALQAEGKTLDEIDSEMSKMLTRGEKGIPGLDLDKIVEQVAPGQAMSRRRAAKQMAKLPPMEQAQKIVSSKVAELALPDEGDMPSVKPDDTKRLAIVRATARKTRELLMSYYESLGEGVRVGSKEEMAKKTRISPEEAYQGVEGIYAGKEEIPGGGKGRIIIGERIKDEWDTAMKQLKALSEGDFGDPANLVTRLKSVGRAIESLTGVIGHEGIHKAAASFALPVANLARGLQASSGKIGTYSDQIISVIDEVGKVGFAPLKAKIAQLDEAIGQGKTGVRDAKTGEVRDIQEVKGQAVKTLMRKRAEELIAYQANHAKELFSKLRAAGVGEEAIDAMMSAFKQYEEKSPDIIQAAQRAGRGAVVSLTEGILKPLKKMDLSSIRQEVDRTVGSRMQEDFAGREQVRAQIPQLMLGEQAIQQGRVAMGIPEQIEMPRGMDPQAEYATQIRELLERSQKEFAKPGDRRGALRDLQKATQQYSKDVSAAQKADPSAQPGVKGFQEAQKAIRQFQANSQQVLVDKAKMLLEAIKVMREGGETDSQRFIKTIQEFFSTMGELQGNMQETLKIAGRGRGGVTSNIATREGVMVTAAQQMGMKPDPGMYKAIIAQTAGTSKEEQARFKQMEAPLEAVHESIKEGGDATKEMTRLWDALISQPETFRENLYKVIEVLGKFSKELGFSMGQFSKGPQDLQAMTKSFKTMFKSIEGEPLGKGRGGIERAMAAKPASKREMLKAKGGGLAESVDFQYKEAIRIAEERAAQLEKVIGTDAFKKMGAAGRQFEPLKFDIIDPATGQVVQRLESQFRKTGKVIKTTMKQAGAATGAFGNQMRQAFRRVVQWGFASGIIYGTVRALRNMVQVITEVQTKMANLAKVMDTSITDFGAMQEAAVGMARNFGISISEVLDGMVVYAQQGLKMGEIMDRTRATLIAVNVTTLNSKEATEALTAVMKLFSSEVGNSMGAVDAWAAVAAKHAITAKDLAMAVQRSGAAAKTAGVSFEDFLGITTAIGAVTRQTGKEVATSTKFMFRAMRRPTAQRELVGLGVASEDITGDLRPAMDILGDLAGKWGDLSRAQQLSTAQAMAGIRHYNSFIILMENFDEALSASVDATNSQGFAVRKNAIAMQTFTKQMQVLKEAAKGFALDLGKVLVPAMTSLVKIAGTVLGAFEVMPDALKQVGMGMAVGLIVVHKSLDMILDTMDAVVGHGAAARVREVGVAPGMMKGFKAIPGLVASAAGAFKGLGKGLFMSLNNLNQFDDSMGAVSKGIFNARAATMGFVKGLGALRAAMLALGIIAAVGALVMLGKELWATKDTGKELEDEMFDQIGKSQDLANQYKSQVSQLQRVEVAYKKLQHAMETVQDPEKFKTAVDAGTFKGAAHAAKEYQDIMGDVALAMAQLDPSKITGMTESGDYIVGMSEGYQNLAISAADAQNAITSAMKTKVLQAYADELTNVTSKWARFKEIMTGAELDPASRLKKSRGEVKRITKEMNELSTQGISPIFLQESLNKAVKEELKDRQEMVAIAGELARTLAEMPVFKSMELAKTAVAGQAEAIEAAVPTGVFGRQATTGSVMMQQLAKSAGMGGVTTTESFADAALLMEQMMRKGIPMRATGEAATAKPGGAALLKMDAAKALAGAFTDVGPEQLDSVARAMQSGITSLHERSGELMFTFWDEFGNTLVNVSASEMQNVLDETSTQMLLLDRSSVEAAAEKTRRLLTLQVTGALAGIRVPGTIELGPARARDLTAQQRMFADTSMVDTLQRLVDIQKEYAEVTRQYNEQITAGNYDEASKAMTKSSEQLKVLDLAMQDMVMAMQLEQFDLTAIAHFNQALQEMQVTIDATATSIRDAEIDEKNRMETIRHTSGALAGQAVMPQFDFGKTLKELGAQERLQMESPGFAQGLSKMTMQKDRITKLSQARADIMKKQADAKEMARDLDAARKRLTGEQSIKQQEGRERGLSQEAVDIMTEIAAGSDVVRSAVEAQTPILQSMEGLLTDLINLQGLSDEEKRKVVKERLKEANIGEITRQLGARGKDFITEATREATGIRPRGPGEEQTGWFGMGGVGSSRFIKEETGFEFATEESKEAYERITDRLLELNEAIARRINDFNDPSVPGAGGLVPSFRELAEDPSRGIGGPLGDAGRGMANIIQGDIEEYKAEMLALKEEFRAIPEVGQFIRGKAETTILAEGRTSAAESKTEEIVNKEKERAAQLAAQAAKLAATGNRHSEAYLKSIQTEQADLARREEGARIAVATRNFAISIENIIDGFEKAEMLFYDKLDSDLEGAFARVGKPGFRTQFEQRELDVEKKRMRPMTTDEYQANQKELADIEFDVKEAKLKQVQDKETTALRLQQSQAEQVRSAMADALFSGELAGSGMEGMVKNYVDTLTEQLATSEQAEMGPRGQLTFQGIPALDDVKAMAQKLKERAAELTRQKTVSALIEGAQPTVSAIENQTAILGSLLEQVATSVEGMEGHEGEEAVATAAGTRAALGLPGGGVGTAQDTFGLMAAQGVSMLPGGQDYGGGRPEMDLGQLMGEYGGLSFYKGAPREYDPDYRVQEQTFRPAGGARMDTPFTDVEKLQMMAGIDSQGAPTRTFRPTGMIPQGTGPIDLTEHMVGLSNRNQTREATDALRSGRRSVTSGSVLTDSETGVASGAQNANRAGRQAPTGASEAQATASQDVAAAIDKLNGTLDTLTQQGISLPADVTAALTDLGGTVTDAIAGVTLTVSVESSVPIDLTDSSISAIGTEISSGAATGGVGAEITSLGQRLDVIEGFAGEGGVLDEQIDQATLDVQTNIPVLIDELTASIDVNSQRIDQIVVRTDAIPPLEDDVAVLQNTVRDLGAGVDQNSREIGRVNETARRASSIAETAQNIARRI